MIPPRTTWAERNRDPLPLFRAFYKKYGTDFTVVHFDAHTDLRDEFQGTRFHHGSVMRRTVELGIPVTHVGIRSVSEEEMEYLKGKGKEKNSVFYAERKHTLEEMVDTLRENVYITVDVDVLDSSVMPATGTPEPGGLTWYQILDAVRAIAAKKKIIGADVVELAPIPGMVAPDFLAAKLAYKIIGFALS
ncbi:MAG: arginase family protein [Parcubacteria group bacterium]|nr:arginase family protein [Parcubacteria group bacterium]